MKSCHFYRIAQGSSKNSMTLSSFSMIFPWLSITFAIFHDFSGLENGVPKFHDFPWPRGTLDTDQRSFADNGPRTWNSLPAELRTPDMTLCSFKRHLKAHLFQQ